MRLERFRLGMQTQKRRFAASIFPLRIGSARSPAARIPDSAFNLSDIWAPTSVYFKGPKSSPSEYPVLREECILPNGMTAETHESLTFRYSEA